MDLIKRNKKRNGEILKFDAYPRPKKNAQSIKIAADRWKQIGFVLTVVGMSVVMSGAPIIGGGVAIVGICSLLVGQFKHRQLRKEA